MGRLGTAGQGAQEQGAQDRVRRSRAAARGEPRLGGWAQPRLGGVRPDRTGARGRLGGVRPDLQDEGARGGDRLGRHAHGKQHGCSRAGSRSAKVCEDHVHALDRWGKARRVCACVCACACVCDRGVAGEAEDLGKGGVGRGCAQDCVRARRSGAAAVLWRSRALRGRTECDQLTLQ